MRRKKNYESSFRAKVSLEAIKGTKTLHQLAAEYKIHPNLVTKWKKEAISKLSTVFQKQTNKELDESLETIENLYKEIGKLKIENDFLKKKLMS